MPTTDPPTTPRPRLRDEAGRAARLLLVAVAALAVVAVAGVVVLRDVVPIPGLSGCVVEIAGTEARLAADQAENAATIAAIGVRRGLPARAVSIALATAYQESKIRNIDYGDRDSLGIFQQRPSMGWGTPEQLQDPHYATNAFYDELVTIDGYEEMRITEAAQAVQRSGFPEAYEDHAADARALASALTGYSPGGQFTCTVGTPSEMRKQQPRDNGLTPRADRVRQDLERAFGELSLGGFAPEGVTEGHQEGSTHYAGRAVDVFVRPVNESNNRRGWAIAQYAVAHAERLEVQTVIFDGRIWTARRSVQGWRDYDPGDRPGDPAVLEHRDHVHVDVFEGE